jgi:DNA processing protein
MTENELIAWLTLSFTPAIGSSRLSRLLAIDSPEHLVQYSHQQLAEIGLKPNQISYIKQQALSEVEACLVWQQAQPNRHILTPLCAAYPAQLKEISAYPAVLFAQGNVRVLSDPQIAIVGSRNASEYGLRSASLFAADLAQKGVTITSGLALGIDGHAHHAALNAGGDSVAVLGSGLNHIYPNQHKDLALRVSEQGVLVSEFRPDVLPRAAFFPRRNRIISGLSLGVFVIEAAEKSGSLITARYANEQGREVFALPGSINNPQARGGNGLIKSGACLVQTSDDILQEINSAFDWIKIKQRDLFDAEDEKEQLPFSELLANVGIEEATSVDILVQRTHIPVHDIMMQLLELELQGYVAVVSGGYIRTRRG